MATRNPLFHKSRTVLAASPRPTKPAAGLKRPRSPGITVEEQSAPVALKRAKGAPDTPSHKLKRKELQETEWREKYIRAIRGWKFHFSEDIQNTDYVKILEKRILQLGATVEDFFSSAVSHLIVKDVEQSKGSDKENRKGNPNKSILIPEVPQVYRRTVDEADIKEWGVRKLDSVLSRCLLQPVILPTSGPLPTRLNPPSSTHGNAGASRSRDLTALLKSEKIHGTSERDPNQKRHDFTYFARGSCFVLVEDVHQELATIAAHQYLPPRKGSSRKAWPELHCHPQSRGPFIPFDEKEKKRWEAAQKMEKEDKTVAQEKELREQQRLKERISREREVLRHGHKGGGDLRRSVSMNNLRRRESLEAETVLDFADITGEADSAFASGYLASGNIGYIAASGNSISITSNTGTTSTTGYNLTSKLPSNLRAFTNAEVPTSRKAGRRDSIKGDMGPPAVPVGANLRRAKSTNNLKLPKREEGSKPGYCESCRVKFENFKHHIAGSKHRKFAKNDANFAQLDFVLERVRRKSTAEIEEERRACMQSRFNITDEDDDHFIGMPDVDLDED